MRSVLILTLVVVMAIVGSSSQARRLECLLLSEQFPGGDRVFVDALKGSLEAQGFVVRPVSDGSVGSDRSDTILILPNSACFPSESRSALVDYLAKGGNLLTIGGPPLSKQVVRLNGEWLTQQMLLDKLASMPPRGTVLDFGRMTPSPDYRDTGTPETEPQIKMVSSGVEGACSAMEVALPSVKLWEFQDIPVTEPFPAGETVTTFWAKGSPNARKLIVAWIDSDDARWNTHIDLTEKWKRYAITANQFVHWKGPGGEDDRLDTRKVVKFKVGFENGNLRDMNEPVTFWITDIRSMPNPAGTPDFAQPTLETLSPSYKTYTTYGTYVRTHGSYSEIEATPLFAGPIHTVCSLPRYRGLGFNKTAPHRWIPQLAVKMADGHIGGAAAALYVQDDTQYKGTVWATFGIEDPKFLASHREEIAREAVRLVKRIDDGMYLLSAGVDRASYFEGDPVAGAVVLNLGANSGAIQIRCSISADPEYAPKKDQGFKFHSAKTFDLTGKRTICEIGPVKSLKPGFYVATVSMSRDGKLIDEIRQPFSVVESKPVPKSELVTIEGDQFIYKGKPWFSLGINYRPVYVASMEEKPFWKYWTHPDQYDAEIVEMELGLMNKIGLNTVALIYENSEQVPPAFVDFMERAHRHGLKCHVYIAGTEPMWPNYDKAKKLIEAARLSERPAMFAYDLGWEVRVGREEKRQGADTAWKRWIEDRYGSVENAEKDWGFELRKDPDGRVHGPTDGQVTEDGPWRRMVAAYRRFWDDRLSRRYMETERFMRKMDPYHPIGVRSGFGGTGTLAGYAVPQMPVDLRSGAKHLDYISPEGYNFSGDLQSFREGGFTTLYGKFVSAGKPVYWAELGFNANLNPTPEMLEAQRQYYEKIYKVFYETRSGGSAAWWWPGYLIWERSDFSIINPDFTLRPSALEFTKMAQIASEPYPLRKPDCWIEIDRDLYTNGYAGMLADKRVEYGKAVSEGKSVGLRSKGTGTDTSSFPRIAVGDTPLSATNCPKFLNAEFNSLKIKGASGKWIAAEDGKVIKVKAGAPVYVRASLGNIAETKWLARGPSAVYLRAVIAGSSVDAPISADTPFFRDAEVPALKLSDGIRSETRASFQMLT
ncbi:MAG: hypothetical protein NTU88_16810, partial [Armatimonadetes bacterium]|nr:hypothetical protein [Armatimonadota bacterium]